ncbi:MAG: LacI family DNA-binding transcriptional regulator [Oscillospiraceae bacterium]|nr:LacI family DNA-binding transcriptional regulator [Oscillospiraceae bacterium]
MATIKDIANLAGVSRGTVDRVLNNRGAVRPEIAERVHSIAQTLNYSPNIAGKTLAIRKKNLRFGFILFASTTSNPFFLDVVRGIESRALGLQEYGVSVNTRYAKIDDPELQASLIDGLAKSGIDGLAITPINHPVVIERVRELTQAGVPVVTVNTDIKDSDKSLRLAYVGSDCFKSGETAAGLMNLVTGGQANVGIIIGHPLVDGHAERSAGFTQKVAQAYSGLNIVGTTVNYDDDLKSFAATKQFLQQHKQINALYLASAGVEGACKAVEETGLAGKIKIISHDSTATTRKLIHNGAIVATITQQPFTQGTKPLDILMNYVGMGIRPEHEFFYTKIEIRIRENI